MKREDVDRIVDAELARRGHYVRIDDPDVVDVMGQVEGPAWARSQVGSRSGYAVPAFVEAYRKLLEVARAEGVSPEEFDANVNPRDWDGPDSDGTIYGEGGYARYVVRSNGEVVLVASSTRPEKIAIARRVGIKVL